jgi:hypothetical protein
VLSADNLSGDAPADGIHVTSAQCFFFQEFCRNSFNHRPVLLNQLRTLSLVLLDAACLIAELAPIEGNIALVARGRKIAAPITAIFQKFSLGQSRLQVSKAAALATPTTSGLSSLISDPNIGVL